MAGISLRFRSLKTKIALATLATFLIGIWSISFGISHMLRNEMQRHQGEQQFATASIVATQINNELKLRFEAMEIASCMIANTIYHGSTSPQTFIKHLTPLRVLFNGGFAVHDAKGAVTANFPGIGSEHDLGYLDTGVVSTAIFYKKTTISRSITSKNSNGQLFSIVTPILDHSGEVIGALSGAIDLGYDNFLSQITNNHYGKSGSYIVVSPQYRSIIAVTKNIDLYKMPSPGENAAIDRFNAGYDGSAVFIDPKGIEVLSSSKSIPAANWRVAVTLPTEEAFEPIRTLQRQLLAATALLSSLAIAWIWWLLSRGLSPLADTANTLAGMVNGSHPFRQLPVARGDEIGHLISSFNHLLIALEQREILLKQILDTSSVAIFLMNTKGEITQANQRMAEIFKRPIETLVGGEYISLIHPSEREIARKKIQELLNSKTDSLDLDRLYWRDDQTEFWGYLTGRNLYDVDGSKKGIVGVISDIDIRKRTEQRLRIIASVFTHAREGIMITEADGTIVEVNDSFTRITGYTSEEVLGQKPSMLHSDRQGGEFYEVMNNKLLRTGEWSGEIWSRRKNGSMYAEMRTITAIRDTKGDIKHYVSLFSDITPSKEHEKQLAQMAHFDVLTALPNRTLLTDRLKQAMAQAQRHNRLLAIIYFDLDGFKAINDRHGREAGDRFLVALAQNVKKSLRKGDTLARLGGDEFVAVLHDLEESSDSMPMINRLIDIAAQPLQIDNQTLQISASLGITFYPQKEKVGADQLLRQADQAMYQAKLSGKNRHHIFDDEQDRNVRGLHESLQRIQEALNANEFVLFFQPKVNMHTGKIIGAEALIRWQHPEKGLLPPAVFLPVIENHPMSVDVGEWVIDTALTARELWQKDGLNIPVSVNVGARQLQQSDFMVRLSEILSRHPPIQAGDLELEILETSALEDMIGISELIRNCDALGVTFALDDFGTGYSSLTYLKRLPVSTLKIDQSFVRNMLDDPENLPILDGIINLAFSFRRTAIAEGVETVDHGKLLLQLGCQLAQGYGIARPMPIADFPAWAKSWQPEAEWQHIQEISHDERPLLFGSFEHSAWVNTVESYLRGETNTFPSQDPHHCRFGRWLDKEGLIYISDNPALETIKQLHEQVHQVANELCESRRQGTLTDLPAKQEKLRALHNSVLRHLPLHRGKTEIRV